LSPSFALRATEGEPGSTLPDTAGEPSVARSAKEGAIVRSCAAWAAAALAALAAVAAPAAEPGVVIRIGWTAWSDAEAVTNIAKEVLEKRLGYKVDLVMTDIGLQYAGVARGNLDVMLMAWLPTTHKAYWDKVSGDVVDLAVLYDHARLGWAVPQYVPESEVGSIADLNKPEARSRLHGLIQGIDPGAGLMRASERALADYALTGFPASSYIWLADFKQAKRHAEQAVVLHESASPESRSPSKEAIARIDLGIALAELGVADEAIGQGHLALASPRVVDSVRSRAADLDAVLTRRYPLVPAAQEFHEEYGSLVRATS